MHEQTGAEERKTKIEDVNFTIVYDNNPYQSSFDTGWGFSCLIETQNGNILFDTGWNGNKLLLNLEKSYIGPGSIKKLLISHNHWDHIGGVNHIIAANPELELYVPTSFSKHLKDELSNAVKVKEIYEPEQVLPGCWSTGEYGKNLKEQGLLVETKNGFVLVTGCAHPGLDVMLHDAQNHGKIYGVLGGLHDFNKFQLLKDLGFIMPCHCTKFKDEIEVYYNHIYVAGGVGKKVTL